MFVDQAKIHIKGGNGGNGCVSFHRAKYVTNGGPDGGDGGRGGSVIFKADTGMNTLMDFRHKRSFKAQSGQDGSKQNRTGKDGEDICIKVPVGTVIREVRSNKVMADMSFAGEEKVIITGGRGGKGNQHFATSTRQSPRYAQPGQAAKEYDIVLELKLIADAGIIGAPNAGKSTLLSMVTNANPKIANYHFTTLAPNLGVVRSKWGEDFVLADIPGLIEGASQGMGLGLNFLRHVERTKVLIHVVDASGLEGDPAVQFEKINHELETYSKEILKLPQVVAVNKMDIPEAQQHFDALKKICEAKGLPVVAVSAATNQNLDELLAVVAGLLKDAPKAIVFEPDFKESTTMVEFFTVEKTDAHTYYVHGQAIDKMMGYTNIDTEKGFAFFQKYLKDEGIIAKLLEEGMAEGDTVKLGNMEFEYFG